MKQLFALGLAVFFSAVALASDHIDGPITTAHPISDLADLYVFPSPENPERLVLAVNTHFAAYDHNHFNGGIVYEFHLREAKLQPEEASIETSNEVKISCYFETPKHHSAHKVFCKTTNGLKVEGPTEQVNEDRGLKVFAGLRADPFFFNFFWVRKVIEKAVIPEPSNNDIMHRLNALSLVVEVDPKELYPEGEGSTFAVAASASTMGHGVSKQLDWVARPEITNVTLGSGHGEDLRDGYNTIKPFSTSLNDWTQFHERIYSNLGSFDQVDGTTNWPEPVRRSFTKILMMDALIVDLSKPCLEENYLSIEMSLLRGQPHSSCGGRQLADDFVDTMFSLYIHAGEGELIRDGVDAPYKSTSSSFPYLAEPELGFKAWIAMRKARILSWFSN